MKKAVIYARYSSERQTEQSIEGQLTVCGKFASDNGFVILNEYIDRATTGTNDNRPAFQQMIKDSANKGWQYVIVYKGDRFSRNRIESAIHKKTLRDNGVKIISATENIPDSPEGIILESLLEGMAEYYSAELSQKVKRGISESRKKKQFTGGFLLYGYDVVDKKPVINDYEAEIVRRIHLEYASGKTARLIVDALVNENIKDKRGNPFKLPTVYRILGQQKYLGDDIFPAIVDKDTKEAVNLITEANKRAPARRKSYGNYLLSGKLLCGECGGLMTGEAGTSKQGNVYHYYKCFEKKKHSRPCTFPSIKKDEIENKVFSVCCDVLSAGFIPQVVDAAYKIHQEDVETNLKIINLESELSEKKKTIDNIMAAIEQGIFTATTRQRLLDLESAVQLLTYQIEKEKAKLDYSVSKEDYLNFFTDLLSKQQDNDDFKQEVIDALVRQVVVFRDKICITFNYNPDDNNGKKRDYNIDMSEYEEVCSDYRNGGESSTLFTLAPPSVNNPNTIVFIKPQYWGVWVLKEQG